MGLGFFSFKDGRFRLFAEIRVDIIELAWRALRQALHLPQGTYITLPSLLIRLGFSQDWICILQYV